MKLKSENEAFRIYQSQLKEHGIMLSYIEINGICKKENNGYII